MLQQKIFINDILEQFIKHNDFGSSAKLLIKNQRKEWLMMADGYASLSTVETKSFFFNGFEIKVQFNPARLISTSAKVDPESIKERKCFLCLNNLPPEQKGILYKNDFLILCNPFPIFPEHFTLSSIQHKPQQIKDSFTFLLSLSKDLSKHYTLFYNGPKCGASAPDHLHFQAGNKYFMPIDNDFHQIKNEYGRILVENEKITIASVDDGLRKFISFESNYEDELLNAFDKFYAAYSSLDNSKEEPLMNILSFYEDGYGWRVIIFLREKHRPKAYFAEGDKKIMLSPAAVDLGGVCITPLEKDFEKINKEILTGIFNEVFISREKLNACFRMLDT